MYRTNQVIRHFCYTIYRTATVRCKKVENEGGEVMISCSFKSPHHVLDNPSPSLSLSVQEKYDSITNVCHAYILSIFLTTHENFIMDLLLPIVVSAFQSQEPGTKTLQTQYLPITFTTFSPRLSARLISCLSWGRDDGQSPGLSWDLRKVINLYKSPVSTPNTAAICWAYSAALPQGK